LLALTKTDEIASSTPLEALAQIERLDQALSRRFKDKLELHSHLTRSLVSFQANKTRAVYRWYKYKEAFSASLIEYLLHKYGLTSGTLLDPFAGSGTALFVATSMGMNAEGIELLPIGQQLILTRRLLESEFAPDDFAGLEGWLVERPWVVSHTKTALPELRITQGAYPQPTHKAIEQYLAALGNENERLQTVLRFALLCVLEAISYTRKDGQYLRWDYRCGRRQGKKHFDKGLVLDFDQAVSAKIQELLFDLRNGEAQKGLFAVDVSQGELSLHKGSCLEIMPKLSDNVYDAIVTSPPYCNRYDYTRTYALELALLGVNERELIQLRQEMLSCTVENRAKDLLSINPRWQSAVAAADRQELLQAILRYLEDQKARGELNNDGIPRMVRGYFYEMACVIAECLRVLKPQSTLLMVNDNVRYAGASLSVDMILSDIAQQLGFDVETILVLPNGKGNSSQQMGEHGRQPLRKCVYVWRKP
jgi:DNA modification methylase